MKDQHSNEAETYTFAIAPSALAIMAHSLCMCCFDAQRPVELETEHLSICRWCVNVLNQNRTSVDQLRRVCRAERYALRGTDAVERDIRRLESLKKPAPVAPTPTAGAPAERAIRQAREEEGFFVGLYRTLVNDRKRIERARAIETALHAADMASYETTLAAHQCEQAQCEVDIATHRAYLIRTRGDVETEVERHFSAMAEPYLTRQAEVRLIRAHLLGLVNADGHGSPRLDTPEYRAVRSGVLKRDRQRCVVCGSAEELHVHHIVSLGTCGTNAACNLATLCADCHDKQHSFRVTRRTIRSADQDPYQ